METGFNYSASIYASVLPYRCEYWMENFDDKQNFLRFSGSHNHGRAIVATSLPIYYNSIGLGIQFSQNTQTRGLLDAGATLVQHLDCGICKNELNDPILLDCFHSFCSNCVARRVLDNQVACFSCNSVTQLKENGTAQNDFTAVESRPDLLLQYLVSGNKPEIMECANCEEMNAMVFCNTCDQALCNECRRLIHSAKMFAKHDVVPVEKRTQKQKKTCDKHGEEYIMYSSTLKSLLCINCFRDLDNEKRIECTDLKTAYTQNSTNLSEAMESLESLQQRTNESIVSISAIRQETVNKADIEESVVLDMYEKLKSSLEARKNLIINQIKEQRQEKEQILATQLLSLQSSLPILEARLLASSAFAKEASVFDLLNLGHHVTSQLLQLLESPFPFQQPQQPQATRDLTKEFKECVNSVLREYGCEYNTCDAETQSEIKNICLEITPLQPNCPTHSNHTLINTSLFPHATSPTSGVYAYATNLGTSDSRVTYSTVNASGSSNAATLPDIVPRQELITYTEKIRAIHTRLMHLKDTVQELHGDLTKRKCQPNESLAQSIEEDSKNEGIVIQEQIKILQSNKAGFEKDWEETVTKVTYEREIFYGHLQELDRLQNENRQLSTIVSSLEPFVKSLNSVSKRLSPMLLAAAKDREQAQIMRDLMNKIGGIESDSNKRLEAIQELEYKLKN